MPAKVKGPATGALSWLIEKCLDSAEWSDLSASTRRRYTVYRAIQETSGSKSLTTIDRGVILAGRDKRRDKPHAVNTFLKAMRGIAPTLNAKLLTGANDEVGFFGWTEDELARFEAKWPVGTRQRLAFDLSLHSGFRRGDAVKIGCQHVRSGELSIRTEKTGNVVLRPILPMLAESTAAPPTGDLAFIISEHGRAFTKESYGN
ncbi:hypothetical protein IPV08_04855 [Methylobacterium sp. SD274]|uniref:hypothetical protein n=1 Tax=Methylobacterium sp. SD274 TaxID=2782009 RepID=UPI001A96734B|nr:hypothetical protein [Methylobacterium sp. SD274]MBO1019296.1 hypothetical protein [Methylobacterium sp. SD274]